MSAIPLPSQVFLSRFSPIDNTAPLTRDRALASNRYESYNYVAIIQLFKEPDLSWRNGRRMPPIKLMRTLSQAKLART